MGSVQALEKSVEAGGALDQYEIEGPDRAELLQDLAEFQLAAVGALLHFYLPAAFSCCLIFSGGRGAASPGKLPSPLSLRPNAPALSAANVSECPMCIAAKAIC